MGSICALHPEILRRYLDMRISQISFEYMIYYILNIGKINFSKCSHYGIMYSTKSEYLSIPEKKWTRGPEGHYFSGMDRYEDFLLPEIHLNIQLCNMTSLHRLT